MRKEQPLSIDWNTFLKAGLLVFVYFGVGRIALFLGSTPAYITPVWPSAGVALAATLMWGYEVWFAIFFGGFLLHITFHGISPTTVVTGLSIGLGNALAPVLATFFLNRLGDRRPLLEHSQTVIRFVVLGAMLSPLISALVGVTSLCLSERAPWSLYGNIWWTWWTSNAVGILIFTPLLLVWRKFPLRRDRLSMQRSTEFLLLLLLFITISIIAFWRGYALEYMLLPLLVWAAFRFQLHGTTLLIVVIAAISIFGTVREIGSFVRPTLTESLLLLQSFIGVVSITALMLCALVLERERAEANLKQANEVLEMRVEERTTALQESEQALQRIATEAADQATEFRALFAAMAEVIVVLDAEGRYLKIAPTNPNPLYKPTNRMLGKTLYDVFPSATADRLLNAIQQALSTQKTTQVEYSLSIQGQEIWFAASLAPTSANAVVLVAQDITERKHSEESLQLSEEKFSKAFRSSANLITITRLSDGKFIEVNENFLSIGGYRPEEVLGRTASDLNLWVNSEQRNELVSLLLQHGAFRNQECQFYTKNRDIKTGLISAEVINLRGTLCALYVMSDITDRKQAEEALRLEQEKSEQLLLNILPKQIADRLKEDQSAIADAIEQATILFADIVGFTPLSSRLSATELVRLLNQIFSMFDSLAEQYGLEKIKTIGDAYMVVGGIPTPREDHAEAIAEMALNMQQEISQFKRDDGSPFNIRIGINTGPVVAGVIGTKKFIYDLWGDTVNVASRMESQGIIGGIQVTTATYEHLKDKYLLEERGEITIKGRGTMQTYWLTGRR
ncbi:MAG: MASE1 domain-containing protein [Scytolyngbya sp. HA4215-MV1]|jgi:PAS domain S-box-containing protein|nr:MASE1 domain-containing protein [Scytolyngbya sp. HA4215-MV1]